MPVIASPSGENLLVGKGQVFFNRLSALGVPTGFRHMGDVESLEFQIADDRLKKYSSMTAPAPLLKEVTKRRDASLKLTANEFHPENVALALMGAVATLIQVATPIVAEAIMPATVPGAYFKLAKIGPHTAVAIKFGAGTGVLNTDYRVVDATMGVYQILATTILTGAVTADYTPTAYTALTGPSILGAGNVGVIQGAMMFVGDPMSGPKMVIDIWKVSITPDTAFQLISEDWASIGLNASVIDDTANHPSYPYYQVTYAP